MKKLFLAIISAIGLVGFMSAVETKSFAFKEDKQSRAMNLKNTTTDLNGYDCSDGWRITGYFTPIETDYDSAETREIEIAGLGKMSFNSEFLNVVFNEDEGFGEGWGKTRFGWYLGNYNGRWHKANAPLDANNSPLDANSVAVDNSLIPTDSAVKIPGLPGEYGQKTFIANDVGVTVHGKHIDVYTGEGRAAEREMYRVTFEDDQLQQVCFKEP
jgi:3D (Asp-Asp-Asp) domain-containing protein